MKPTRTTSAQLILASSSPFRKALMEKLSIPFVTDSPNIDESRLPAETIDQYVARLSETKAQVVAERSPENSIIIGSDQVATFGDEVLGKPGTRSNAIAQLEKFAGHRIKFVTGLCLIDNNTQQKQTIIEPFFVVFRSLSREQIERYIDREQPLNCAGSFKSEGLGITLFERLEGDDPNTLIGLPLIRLVQLLDNIGIQLP